MTKLLILANCLLFASHSFSQDISQKIEKAYATFEADSQLRHAMSSLYVINAKTGEVVFDKNSQIGLAPASTQKIITASTAFELLGKDYRYKTELGYQGMIRKDSLDGYILIRGSGDPTFGSWRYSATKPELIYDIFSRKILSAGIRHIGSTFHVDESKFDPVPIPDGWIWQDIGNYYGAGTWGLNWKENQFDLILASGNSIGSDVGIISKDGKDRTQYYPQIQSKLKAAAKGTGDNAYLYLPVANSDYVAKGTIPVGETSFKISGATNNGPNDFVSDFSKYLERLKILPKPDVLQFTMITDLQGPGKNIYTHYSPTLDSIIYWFLQRSINLYGEALVKTFAFKKYGYGSTDSGVAIVKDFWRNKGIDIEELNIMDGSGLSPQNRVTTHAQVEVLKYAKTRDWFPYFYNALPVYNEMKMKSGSIKDVKGFCGYQKSSDGSEYIFSFLVNNYNGRSSSVVNKMYKVLDVLK